MESSLKRSYAVIGKALLDYEVKARHSGPDYSLAFSELREDLVFVAVEILESYLEDLLNMKVGDQSLYIAPERCRWKNIRCELWVSGFALLVGSLLFLWGFTVSSAALIALVTSLPLIGLFNVAPFRIKRRVLFARALSREIARRRGRDDEAGRSSIAIRDFFLKPGTQGLPGAARYRYH